MIQSFIANKVNLFRNEWPRYLIVLVWCLINFTVFMVTYFQYHSAIEYFYLRKFVQNGLSLSRASATCINLNSAVLLLLVCRNFLSFTRYFLRLPTNIIRTIDKHVSFHRYIGYLIIFFSILHALGHVHNLEGLVNGQNMASQIVPINSSSSDDQILPGLLSTLSSISGSNYINPVRKPNSIPILECLKLLAGVSGIILCLILAIIASSSSEYIRRCFYNLFWYIHQIGAIIYFVFISIHGLQGIIRKQVNVANHDPIACYKLYSQWPTQSPKCDVPTFTGNMATSYIWVMASILIYLVERLTRFIRGLRKHTVEIYQIHPSNVLELRILNNTRPSKINYRPGQYVFLNVSQISFLEWHPFTVTSSPSDRHLTVHIRNAGDWTSKLIEKIKSPDNLTPKIKHISIDGPYGTSAEDVFKYQHLVLIGAGIGVTPYASILKELCHKLNSDQITIKKLDFFWICPSIDTFEWFGALLQDLETKMKNTHRTNIELELEYKLYLTRGWSLKEAKQIVRNDTQLYDLFTGLKQKTNYGRPNFDLFFKEYYSKLSNDDSQANGIYKVGVFFCGPQQLSHELHIMCNTYSNEKIKFFYNKENF